MQILKTDLKEQMQAGDDRLLTSRNGTNLAYFLKCWDLMPGVSSPTGQFGVLEPVHARDQGERRPTQMYVLPSNLGLVRCIFHWLEPFHMSDY